MVEVARYLWKGEKKRWEISKGVVDKSSKNVIKHFLDKYLQCSRKAKFNQWNFGFDRTQKHWFCWANRRSVCTWKLSMELYYWGWVWVRYSPDLLPFLSWWNANAAISRPSCVLEVSVVWPYKLCWKQQEALFFVPGVEGWDCSIDFCWYCNCQQGGGTRTTMVISCNGRHANARGSMLIQGHNNHIACCPDGVSKLCTLKEKFKIMNKAEMNELAIYNAWIWIMRFNRIMIYSKIDILTCSSIIMITRLRSATDSRPDGLQSW